MTTTTAEPATPTSTTGEAAAPAGPRGFLARNRASLLIGLGLVAAVAIAALTGGADNTTPMDHDNAEPPAARAVWRVLEA